MNVKIIFQSLIFKNKVPRLNITSRKIILIIIFKLNKNIIINIVIFSSKEIQKNCVCMRPAKLQLKLTLIGNKKKQNSNVVKHKQSVD